MPAVLVASGRIRPPPHPNAAKLNALSERRQKNHRLRVTLGRDAAAECFVRHSADPGAQIVAEVGDP